MASIVYGEYLRQNIVFKIFGTETQRKCQKGLLRRPDRYLVVKGDPLAFMVKNLRGTSKVTKL